MQSKKTMITLIVIIVVGGGAFFGGTLYEKNSLSKQGLLRSAANGQGGQRGGGQFGQGRSGGPGGASSGQGDFVAGDMISKDDKSITVKTRDGGSKIIYFSDSTMIGKSVSGSSSDLATGQAVMANGKTSPDGSLAAQNIQIRPNGN